MDRLPAVAARLDEASSTLTAVARAVAAAGPAPTDFGADGPGRPGDLGRALYRLWVTATDNRAREATAAAARLDAAASAIRDAADRYADTDDAVRRRLTAHHAPDRYAPDRYAPDRYAPDGYVPDRYAPDGYVPDRYAPDRYAPDGYAAGGYADTDAADSWFDSVPAGLGGPRFGADAVPAGRTGSGYPFPADDPLRVPRVPRPRPGDG
ncbi:hypothetical protein GA0074692_4692 [Micromonospora pallida]|uniref:Excreted virulence factor EspC, type VII ESX diderm n=1 Tax=Micromonospora pallida TaxID=145854 RepID=A0A1C6T6V8_9ACTN|nr:hypothetical protein GA0074692_4692 [Micromonospora pallida]